MLEPAFGENRHIKTSNGLDAAGNNFAFQAVEFLDRHVGERYERNAFGNFDVTRTCVRTEAVEAKLLCGSLGARVAAAQAAAVRERVFDAAHTPAFLVQHQVVHYAADGQFRVFLDRIILQIFVAAVAVDEEFPVRIARADAAAERQAHGSAFDIERFVVFEDADGFRDIDGVEVRFNRFEEQAESKPVEEFTGLLEVRAVAEIQRESFEPARIHAEFLHDVIGDEKYRTAVDAAGEADPDRRLNAQR